MSVVHSQRVNFKSKDSPSLWNYTLSPGWTEEEVGLLKKALMKFGMGSWKAITDSRVLPGKSPAQLNLQTQRLMGQQSLAGFVGIKLDPSKVFEENRPKEGMRKNGCLINTGSALSKADKKRLLEENRKKYELSQEEVDAIVVEPLKVDPEEALKIYLNDRKRRLRRMKQMLAYMEDSYKQRFQKEVPQDAPLDDVQVKMRKKSEFMERIINGYGPILPSAAPPKKEKAQPKAKKPRKASKKKHDDDESGSGDNGKDEESSEERILSSDSDEDSDPYDLDDDSDDGDYRASKRKGGKKSKK
eukprot:TRINITY_DN17939_c0_g1_i1.p1 TRINITY_DN17939_c0_g1~~TRINITY_DN17939_c0_g1_i1.p1  ORF type:complete len:301 (+),score=96.88 TRINITY_DN17939_c0_g1_i1:30-932(+)